MKKRYTIDEAVQLAEAMGLSPKQIADETGMAISGIYLWFAKGKGAHYAHSRAMISEKASTFFQGIELELVAEAEQALNALNEDVQYQVLKGINLSPMHDKIASVQLHELVNERLMAHGVEIDGQLVET